MKQKLKAIGYLSKLKDYRLIHHGSCVVLEHCGMYGWCSGGSYKTWKEIERVHFNKE